MTGTRDFAPFTQRSQRVLAITVRAGALIAALVLAPVGGTAKESTGTPAILADPRVMASSALPDYSYAGYGFGLKAIPKDVGTVVDVTDHGATANDGIDDSKAVLRALAAATAIKGKVTVRFPPGRFQISEILPIERSQFVLEGSGVGPNGTELYFPRPLMIADKSHRQDELREYLKREDKYQREPEQNLDVLFSAYSWSGGFVMVGPKGVRPFSYDSSKDKRDPVVTPALAGSQFTRKLTVKNARSLRVGQVVQLQWFSSDGPDSAILRSLYGDPSQLREPIGSHHWTFPDRPVVGQSTRITAIRGNTITLGDPLLHDVSERQPAVIADWKHLTDIGIQNMRLSFPESPWFGHHLEQGYNAIYMTGVFDGWIRNLVIDNADSAVLTDNAASLTIRDVRTTGSHKAHYSVHIGSVHNVLVSDLRVENPVIHPLSVNTRSTKSVYRRATVMSDAVLDQHSGSNHQNLFDQVTLSIAPKRGASGEWSYRLWEGGGAPYWKPGHGRYNTFWNVEVVVDDGRVPQGEPVTLTSGLEGPGARIVGLHGNRQFAVKYTPEGYVEAVNHPTKAVPSLYDYQLARRRAD